MKKDYLAPRSGYAEWLADLKERVKATQLRAAHAVNRELVTLYWEFGYSIVERQRRHKWGDGVIRRLSRDLEREFPDAGGFSLHNLYRMRAFYLGYAEAPAIVAQPVLQLEAGKTPAPREGAKVAQAVLQLPQGVAAELKTELDGRNVPASAAALPWGHNVLLLQKIDDPILRLWYARKAVELGWSRAALANHCRSKLHRREGRAVSNFGRTLPPAQSELAQQVLKDPYNFDFLTLRTDAHERDLKKALLDQIQKFLLELGVGFAFVGRQVKVAVDGQDYFIDLLFYHFRLRSFVVVDLKNEAFKAEFAGKMNFYLSVVDDRMRHPDDRPSIGLLLCKEHSRLTVDYALRDVGKPVGVAGWRTKLIESLPRNLRGNLPTIREIEEELGEPKRTGASRSKGRPAKIESAKR